MNRKKRRTVFQRVLLVLNLITAVGLLLSYTAAFLSPAGYWIIALFGLAYPAFLILNAVFVMIWLVLWRWYLFISLILIIAGWSYLMTYIPIHGSADKKLSGKQIGIISYNIHHFYGSTRSTAQSIPENREKIIDFIAVRLTDIICIQEFYAIGEDFDETFKNFTESIRMEQYHFVNYKKFWNRKKIVAIATFSRFPVVGKGYLNMEGHSLYAIYTDLFIDSDTVRVYNLHLESTRFGDEDYNFISNLTDPDKETPRLTEGSKKMLWKLRRAFMIRAEQVKQLQEHIAQCNYPVILAGDFNDAPTSFTYQRLTRQLKDSYREAGKVFFESTYSGKLPSFRIDYILHSDEFAALSYQKFNLDLSDHEPVGVVLIKNR